MNLRKLIMVMAITLPFIISCNSKEKPATNTHKTSQKSIKANADKSTASSKIIDKAVDDTRESLPKNEQETVEPYLLSINEQTKIIRELNEQIKKDNEKYLKLVLDKIKTDKEKEELEEKLVKTEEELKQVAKSKLLLGYTIAGGLAIILIGLGIYTTNLKLGLTGGGMSACAAGLSLWHDNIAYAVGFLFAGVIIFFVGMFFIKRIQDNEAVLKETELVEKDEALDQVVRIVEHLKKELPEDKKNEFFQKEHRAIHITNEKTRDIIKDVKRKSKYIPTPA